MNQTDKRNDGRKVKCSTPKCRCKATLQLLGSHPICRKCGDVKNAKSRERSAARRAQGQYSPSIMARWSEHKRARMDARSTTPTEGRM